MQLVKRSYFVISSIICLLIVLKSIDYINPDFTKGFLLGKKESFEHYKLFLYAHIIASPIALLAGIFQFSFTHSKHHRLIGKTYVLSILLFASPGGFYMAWFAIGGTLSVINFCLMAILWFHFTYKAYLHAKQRQITKHKVFMIRSFILTNSAIFIRVLSFINHSYELVELTTGYILISFLSWAPQLLIFESYLQLKRSSKTPLY